MNAPSAARPARPCAPEDAALALRGISKSYLGTRALSGVDLDIHAGETLGPGLLASILRDLKLTREQLQKLL